MIDPLSQDIPDVQGLLIENLQQSVTLENITQKSLLIRKKIQQVWEYSINTAVAVAAAGLILVLLCCCGINALFSRKERKKQK
jgi:hypothetical protein